MKESEGNIWKMWGSCISTWQMDPAFGMFLTATWKGNKTQISRGGSG